MAPVLYKPPPVTPTSRKRRYGNYCIKARGTVVNKTGTIHIDVTGFDTSMTIIDRVTNVLRTKSTNLEMIYTEVEVVILPETRLICDGTIFARYIPTGVTFAFPPDSFL